MTIYPGTGIAINLPENKDFLSDSPPTGDYLYRIERSLSPGDGIDLSHLGRDTIQPQKHPAALLFAVKKHGPPEYAVS